MRDNIQYIVSALLHDKHKKQKKPRRAVMRWVEQADRQKMSGDAAGWARKPFPPHPMNMLRDQEARASFFAFSSAHMPQPSCGRPACWLNLCEVRTTGTLIAVSVVSAVSAILIVSILRQRYSISLSAERGINALIINWCIRISLCVCLLVNVLRFQHYTYLLTRT